MSDRRSAVELDCQELISLLQLNYNPLAHCALGRYRAKMMFSKTDSILNQLLTEDLSGVVFVRDYIQLQFNPNPTINVYAECWVKTDSEEVKFGDSNFANLIISQIGKDVVEIEENDEFIFIKFKDASQIEINLKSEWIGEAAVMFGRNEEIQSWPR